VPEMRPDFTAVIESLNRRDHAVIAVAEGFGKKDPAREAEKLNAAEYFVKKLNETGIESNKRIVTESFSRDIRGAIPNNTDIALAQRMAAGTVKNLLAGETEFMYAVNGNDEDVLAFDVIATDNTVPARLVSLANRLTGRRSR